MVENIPILNEMPIREMVIIEDYMFFPHLFYGVEKSFQFNNSDKARYFGVMVFSIEPLTPTMMSILQHLPQAKSYIVNRKLYVHRLRTLSERSRERDRAPSDIEGCLKSLPIEKSNRNGFTVAMVLAKRKIYSIDIVMHIRNSRKTQQPTRAIQHTIDLRPPQGKTLNTFA